MSDFSYGTEYSSKDTGNQGEFKHEQSEFKGLNFSFRIENSQGVPKLILTYLGTDKAPTKEEYEITLTRDGKNVLDRNLSKDQAFKLAKNSVRIIALHHQRTKTELQHLTVKNGQIVNDPSWNNVSNRTRTKTKDSSQEAIDDKVKRVHQKMVQSLGLSPLSSNASKENSEANSSKDSSLQPGHLASQGLDGTSRDNPDDQMNIDNIGHPRGSNFSRAPYGFSEPFLTPNPPGYSSFFPHELQPPNGDLSSRLDHIQSEISNLKNGSHDPNIHKHVLELLRKEAQQTYSNNPEALQATLRLINSLLERLEKLPLPSSSASDEDRISQLENRIQQLEAKTPLSGVERAELAAKRAEVGVLKQKTPTPLPELLKKLKKLLVTDYSKEALSGQKPDEILIKELSEIIQSREASGSSSGSGDRPIVIQEIKEKLAYFKSDDEEWSSLKAFIELEKQHTLKSLAPFLELGKEVLSDTLDALDGDRLKGPEKVLLETLIKEKKSAQEVLEALCKNEQEVNRVTSSQSREAHSRTSIVSLLKQQLHLKEKLLKGNNNTELPQIDALLRALTIQSTITSGSLETIANQEIKNASNRTAGHNYTVLTQFLNNYHKDSSTQQQDETDDAATFLKWRSEGTLAGNLDKQSQEFTSRDSYALLAGKGQASINKSKLTEIRQEIQQAYDTSIQAAHKDNTDVEDTLFKNVGKNLTRKFLDPNEKRPRIEDLDLNAMANINSLLTGESLSSGVILAEPGSGKTYSAEQFAYYVYMGYTDFPAGTEVIMMDSGQLEALYKKELGTFNGQLKTWMEKWESHTPKPILLFDELHTFIDAGTTWSGGQGVLDSIKTQLADKKLNIIGMSTPKEWERELEKSQAINRRFYRYTLPKDPPHVVCKKLSHSDKAAHTSVIYAAAKMVDIWAKPPENQPEALITRTKKFLEYACKQRGKTPDKLEVTDLQGSMIAYAHNMSSSSLGDASSEHIQQTSQLFYEEGLLHEFRVAVDKLLEDSLKNNSLKDASIKTITEFLKGQIDGKKDSGWDSSLAKQSARLKTLKKDIEKALDTDTFNKYMAYCVCKSAEQIQSNREKEAKAIEVSEKALTQKFDEQTQVIYKAINSYSDKITSKEVKSARMLTGVKDKSSELKTKVKSLTTLSNKRMRELQSLKTNVTSKFDAQKKSLEKALQELDKISVEDSWVEGKLTKLKKNGNSNAKKSLQIELKISLKRLDEAHEKVQRKLSEKENDLTLLKDLAGDLESGTGEFNTSIFESKLSSNTSKIDQAKAKLYRSYIDADIILELTDSIDADIDRTLSEAIDQTKDLLPEASDLYEDEFIIYEKAETGLQANQQEIDDLFNVISTLTASLQHISEDINSDYKDALRNLKESLKTFEGDLNAHEKEKDKNEAIAKKVKAIRQFFDEQIVDDVTELLKHENLPKDKQKLFKTLNTLFQISSDKYESIKEQLFTPDEFVLMLDNTSEWYSFLLSSHLPKKKVKHKLTAGSISPLSGGSFSKSSSSSSSGRQGLGIEQSPEKLKNDPDLENSSGSKASNIFETTYREKAKSKEEVRKILASEMPLSAEERKILNDFFIIDENFFLDLITLSIEQSSLYDYVDTLSEQAKDILSNPFAQKTSLKSLANNFLSRLEAISTASGKEDQKEAFSILEQSWKEDASIQENQRLAKEKQSIEKSFATIGKKYEGIEGRVQALEVAVFLNSLEEDDGGGSFSNMRMQLQMLTEKQKALETSHQEEKEQLEELIKQAQTKQLGDDFIKELESRLDHLKGIQEADKKAVGQKIQALEGRVQGIEDELENHIANFKDTIGEIKSKQEELKSQSGKEKQKTLESIASLRQELLEKINSQAKDLKENDTAIRALNLFKGSLENDIAEVNRELELQKKHLETLEHKLEGIADDLRKKIEENSLRITILRDGLRDYVTHGDFSEKNAELQSYIDAGISYLSSGLEEVQDANNTTKDELHARIDELLALQQESFSQQGKNIVLLEMQSKLQADKLKKTQKKFSKDLESRYSELKKAQEEQKIASQVEKMLLDVKILGLKKSIQNIQESQGVLRKQLDKTKKTFLQKIAEEHSSIDELKQGQIKILQDFDSNKQDLQGQISQLSTQQTQFEEKTQKEIKEKLGKLRQELAGIQQSEKEFKEALEIRLKEMETRQNKFSQDFSLLKVQVTTHRQEYLKLCDALSARQGSTEQNLALLQEAHNKLKKTEEAYEKQMEKRLSGIERAMDSFATKSQLEKQKTELNNILHTQQNFYIGKLIELRSAINTLDKQVDEKTQKLKKELQAELSKLKKKVTSLDERLANERKEYLQSLAAVNKRVDSNELDIRNLQSESTSNRLHYLQQHAQLLELKNQLANSNFINDQHRQQLEQQITSLDTYVGELANCQQQMDVKFSSHIDNAFAILTDHEKRLNDHDTQLDECSETLSDLSFETNRISQLLDGQIIALQKQRKDIEILLENAAYNEVDKQELQKQLTGVNQEIQKLQEKQENLQSKQDEQFKILSDKLAASNAHFEQELDKQSHDLTSLNDLFKTYQDSQAEARSLLDDRLIKLDQRIDTGHEAFKTMLATSTDNTLKTLQDYQASQGRMNALFLEKFISLKTDLERKANKTELEKLERTVESLGQKLELETLDRKLLDLRLKREIRRLEDQQKQDNRDIETQLISLKKQQTDNRKEIISLQQTHAKALSEVDKRINGLEEKAKQNNEEGKLARQELLKQLTLDRMLLNRQMHLLNERIDSADETSRKELQQLKSDYTAKFDSLSQKLDKRTKELQEDFNTKIANIDTKVGNLHANIRSLGTDFTSLQTEVTQQKQEIEIAKGLGSDALEKIAAIEKDQEAFLLSYTDTMLKLRGDISSLEDEVAKRAYKDELANLSQQVKEEKEATEKRKETIDSQLHNLSSQQSSLSSDQKALKKSLEKEQTRLNQRVTSLSSQQGKLERALGTLQDEVKGLQKAQKDFSTQLKKTTQIAEEGALDIKKLQEAYTESQGQYKALSDEYNRNKEALEREISLIRVAANFKNAQQQLVLESLQNKLKELEKDQYQFTRSTATEVTALKAEIAKKVDKTQHKKDLEELTGLFQNEMAELKKDLLAQISETDKKIDEAKGSLESLKQEFASSKISQQEKEAKEAKIQKAIEELTSFKNQTLDSLKALQVSQKQDLDNMQEALSARIDSLDTKVNAVNGSLAAAHSAINQIQNLKGHMLDKQAALESQLSQVIQDLGKLASDQDAHRDYLTQVKSGLETSLAGVISKNSELDNKLEDALERVGSLETQIKTKADLSKVADIAEDLRLHKQNMQIELEQLKDTLSKKDAAYKEAMAQSEETIKLANELASLREKISTLNTRVTKAGNREDQLRKDMQTGLSTVTAALQSEFNSRFQQTASLDDLAAWKKDYERDIDRLKQSLQSSLDTAVGQAKTDILLQLGDLEKDTTAFKQNIMAELAKKLDISRYEDERGALDVANQQRDKLIKDLEQEIATLKSNTTSEPSQVKELQERVKAIEEAKAKESSLLENRLKEIETQALEGLEKANQARQIAEAAKDDASKANESIAALGDLNELRSQLTQLIDELKRQKEEAKKKGKGIPPELEERLNNLEAAKATSEEQVREIVKKQLNDKLPLTPEQLLQMKHNLEAQGNSLAEMQQTMTTLSSDVDELKKWKQDTDDRINLFSTAFKKAKDLPSMEAIKTEMQAMIALKEKELLKKISEVQSESRAGDENLRLELEKQYSNLQQQMGQLESHFANKLKDAVSGLVSTEDFRKYQDEVLKQKNASEEQIRDLEAEKESLRAQAKGNRIPPEFTLYLQNLERQIQQQHSALEVCNKAITEVDTRLTQKQNKLEEELRNKASIQDLQGLKSKYDELKGIVEAQKSAIEREIIQAHQKPESEAKNREINALREKLSNVERQMESMTRETDKRLQELEKTKASKNDLNRFAEQMLDTFMKRQDSLLQELNKAKKEKDKESESKLKSELDILRSDISHLNIRQNTAEKAQNEQAKALVKQKEKIDRILALGPTQQSLNQAMQSIEAELAKKADIKVEEQVREIWNKLNEHSGTNTDASRAQKDFEEKRIDGYIRDIETISSNLKNGRQAALSSRLMDYKVANQRIEMILGTCALFSDNEKKEALMTKGYQEIVNIQRKIGLLEQDLYQQQQLSERVSTILQIHENSLNDHQSQIDALDERVGKLEERSTFEGSAGGSAKTGETSRKKQKDILTEAQKQFLFSKLNERLNYGNLQVKLGNVREAMGNFQSYQNRGFNSGGPGSGSSLRDLISGWGPSQSAKWLELQRALSRIVDVMEKHKIANVERNNILHSEIDTDMKVVANFLLEAIPLYIASKVDGEIDAFADIYSIGTQMHGNEMRESLNTIIQRVEFVSRYFNSEQGEHTWERKIGKCKNYYEGLVAGKPDVTAVRAKKAERRQEEERIAREIELKKKDNKRVAKQMLAKVTRGHNFLRDTNYGFSTRGEKPYNFFKTTKGKNTPASQRDLATQTTETYNENITILSTYLQNLDKKGFSDDPSLAQAIQAQVNLNNLIEDRSRTITRAAGQSVTLPRFDIYLESTYINQ